MAYIPSISACAFVDEKELVHSLLQQAGEWRMLEGDICLRAKVLAGVVRNDTVGEGVESFLNTYSLETSEGVALMCLAEALLRIPDKATADALIRSTFEGRHWGDYTSSAASWKMSLSSWGLLLTGRVVDYGQDAHAGALRTLKHLVGRAGEPLIREALKAAMAWVGSQFVLGQCVDEALAQSVPYSSRGYRFSYDILGEGARTDAQAGAYVAAYCDGIRRIGRSFPKTLPLFEAPGVSIKLSALHPRYQLTQRGRVMAELLPRLKSIMSIAKEEGVAVSLDAEEASRLDCEMLLFEALLEDDAFAGWNGIGFVVQAYQKRALAVVDWLAHLAVRHKRVIPVRLVKGAYWDGEIKHAQLQGLSAYPVFTHKSYTDLSYLVCANRLLTHPELFYPQFATHNARTLASVIAMAGHKGWRRGSYECQRLHGMGEVLHDAVLAEVPSRIYAPIGTYKDLLAYLIRRLLENGANTSFVRQVKDKTVSVEGVVADPVAEAARQVQKEERVIPLPLEIYGQERCNSQGIEWGNLHQVQALQAELRLSMQQPITALSDTDSAALEAAIVNARRFFPVWSVSSVQQRAELLEHIADLLEQRRAEFIALCVREGGKTLTDAVAEVREAADFCRYYAAQARELFQEQVLTGVTGERNVLSLHPRGVFVCISPWNFPLAIFVGQVAAALVTGNIVIAKPAEQTVHIAHKAVQLMYEAGLPTEALHLVMGKGESVGAALVSDARTDGVVFTGGTETAKNIAQALARRAGALVPLIAETGGQNCMVVDSSALLERAVDDIVLSAFGSAGQRCSGLRVLFVQADIANELLTLLAGAMQELRLGDPQDISTDIGPVIDREAQAALLSHIERMKREARFVASSPEAEGCFVAPHLFEIESISQLRQEVFGPVLHVIRFQAEALQQVVEAINSTGYGLTFGIHSRIESNIHLLSSQVRAGNIYVNRSMIGATVGVQPFGGEGLSGTGFKAGGPHYLLRFVTERAFSTNTASVGGDIKLLARERLQ